MYLTPLIAIFAFAPPAPLQAQRELTRIPDPDPELERRSFRVAPGFEVNLFAADPLLAKPIQMNFDPAGRLWVACSEAYPQIRPGQPASDKIVILEDRHGTGRADRATVFADGLLIPTGVEPGDGGAYVADSTDLLHLEDTVGDGRAHRRRVVLSGFGTEDTHHILHTLRWGPDGLLYFNQSIYIHSHIETPYGVRRLGGGGIWQFRPESRRLEVWARGFVNPWGHVFDRWGQEFVTDGAYGEGINYLVPGASYATAVGAVRILEGLNPGSPKHCGAEILSGGHLPEEWRGNILTNDFRGHRVCRFVLADDEAGFTSREAAELIRTDHAAFRPVDIKMGPDGAIYIADWYNPIIQHGEVDFRDPRRDLTHGRIWRVTARGRPLVPRPTLVGAPTDALLDALTAPENWTRQQAKRVLKERGPSILPALATWTENQRHAGPAAEPQLLEALWVHQALDVPDAELLTCVVHATDPRVRAAAARVAGAWHDRLPDPLALLGPLAIDSHPRVRLEAVRALARVPSSPAAEFALAALDRPVDKFLDYALWLTARELEPFWLPAARSAEDPFLGNRRHLLFALLSIEPAKALPALLSLVKAGEVPEDQKEKVLARVASDGAPADLALVFETALGTKPGSHADSRLLSALEDAARKRGVRPAGELDRIGALLDAGSEDDRTTAARLAGLWRVERLRPRLAALASEGGASRRMRRAAVEGLARLGGKESSDILDRLADSSHPLDLRQAAVCALTKLDLKAAAGRAADLLTTWPASEDPSEVFTAFLQRKNGPDALANALLGRSLPPDVARLGLRTLPAAGTGAASLAKTLAGAAKIGAARPELSREELRQRMRDVSEHGDPVRGERVFRRKELSCLKCHAIAGAGGQVGPDLTGIGASVPVDYLIESILLPNKAVKENYHTQLVVTNDGRVFAGVKVRESATELVLRDIEGRDLAIAIGSIEERGIGRSLMPDGLTDGLTRAEFADLVRFLAELGKVGPFTPGKSPMVRRWQVLEPAPDVLPLVHARGLGPTITESSTLTWSPAYSTVSGVLPLDAVPVVSLDAGDPSGFARCQVEVSAAGKVRFKLAPADGLTVWMDRVPVAPQRSMSLDLTIGTHTLTLGIDRARAHADIGLELEEVPGSGARVRAVAGK